MIVSTAGRTKLVSHVVPMQKCRRHKDFCITLPLTSNLKLRGGTNETNELTDRTEHAMIVPSIYIQMILGADKNITKDNKDGSGSIRS